MWDFQSISGNRTLSFCLFSCEYKMHTFNGCWDSTICGFVFLCLSLSSPAFALSAQFVCCPWPSSSLYQNPDSTCLILSTLIASNKRPNKTTWGNSFLSFPSIPFPGFPPQAIFSQLSLTPFTLCIQSMVLKVQFYVLWTVLFFCFSKRAWYLFLFKLHPVTGLNDPGVGQLRY